MKHKLNSIVVLYRQPDTLALWGIPYAMRPGQQPRDLFRAHRDYVPPPPGHYGRKQIDISDWIWLGSPGWWGTLSKEEQGEIEAFLRSHEGDIPQGPDKWRDIRQVDRQ